MADSHRNMPPPFDIAMSPSTYFATAPKHLESLLAQELRDLGLTGVGETRGGASFSGPLEDAYRACLWSRVANRVLLSLASFPAAGADALYAGVRELPWEDHLSAAGTFAVRLDGTSPGVAHSRFGALRVKDAVVDRFRERRGGRPSVDTDRPDLRIHAHLRGGQASLALDLSGSSMHLRGYRRLGSAAPLKENLAAAILLRAGWPAMAARGATLLDPLCGSGTLCIEGAMIAADIAPGLLRTYWGLSGWRGHDAACWSRLLEEARGRRGAGLERLGAIRGYDADPAAVRAALDNLSRAGLAGRVHFERRELRDCAPAREDETGLVVVNPPYGQRLGRDSDLAGLYALLGSILRERFRGWRTAVFTGNPELGKNMGLRASRHHALYNGPIACRLLHFEVGEEAFVSDRPRPLPPDQRGPGAQMLANRLRKNQGGLQRWLHREGVTCYRLYDADLPEYAVALDVYQTEAGERIANVQEYQAPASVDPRAARRRLREALGVIPEVLGIPDARLYFRVRRRQRGGAQYERLGSRGNFHRVEENGLRFLVNFEDYLDTGLFLDHRDTRRLIGALARGRRFLNLFGYTGAASVYAAAGGAAATTTVDLSRTYLDWALRNLTLNGFGGRSHRLVQADCLSWLRAAAKQSERWGLIFLDPPSFSSSKRMTGTLDIQRDHARLILDAAALLAEDGILLFSNNLRRFRLDLGTLGGLLVEDITKDTIPRDFARNPRIHSCWRIGFQRDHGPREAGAPRPIGERQVADGHGR
jgi:23S rRNA (guanine2445-N2)-methyltransferase / 23S rRNA (guanine2069-N7)-methyltransferase